MPKKPQKINIEKLAKLLEVKRGIEQSRQDILNRTEFVIPKAGVDYFTEAEKKQWFSAISDYIDKLFIESSTEFFSEGTINDIKNLVFEEIKPLIKNGKDGKDGKDAIVDYEAIISKVVSELDLPDYEKLIEKTVKKIDAVEKKTETLATKKEVEDIKDEVKQVEIKLNERISLSGRVAGGGSNVTVKLNGALVGSGTILDFSGSGISSITHNGNTASINISGGGISDGDKGDITVSGSGTVWTIDNDTIGLDELSATGTPSASTFLRGDNTWASISATPGGSNTQVQYNNAGSFGGISGATTNGTNMTFGTGNLLVQDVKASGSGGVAIKNSSGTTVADFGAGSSTNVSLVGAVNMGTGSADYAQYTGGTGVITNTATGSSTDIDITVVPKGTGKFKVTGDVNISGLTASQLTATDASKNLVSLSTTTYPSLTELSYIKGVTSAIQTQIDAKFTLPSLTSGSVLFSNGTTIAQDNTNFFWDDTNNRLSIGNPSIKLGPVNWSGTAWATVSGSNSGLTINNGSDQISYVANGYVAYTGSGTVTMYNILGNLEFQTAAAKSIIFNQSGLDQDFRVEGDTDANLLFVDGSADKVGMGTATPSAKLHAISTTEQLRLGYDASNYFNATINSTGSITFDLTGTTPEFTFSDAVNVPDEAYGAGWNGSTQVPTKNAIYDKIETLGGGSGITRTVVVTSGSATMGSAASTDYVYFVAGAHTMSLPAASGNTNRYTIKNNHSANITIDTAGAENIEGAASISIAPEESVDIISDGTNWFVV